MSRRTALTALLTAAATGIAAYFIKDKNLFDYLQAKDDTITLRKEEGKTFAEFRGSIYQLIQMHSSENDGALSMVKRANPEQLTPSLEQRAVDLMAILNNHDLRKISENQSVEIKGRYSRAPSIKTNSDYMVPSYLVR